ncbi:DNA-binding transcriptional LysR family regulator [Ureibacillus xyleni]|uniref:DNA-binding transcriptional LysR family regulator n=1 Tax=Ureibacillus xyleni TaxID=614648 RepID=A0A285TPZ7_9BACL|nr:LysR family transcriptional regulator [Ureibacillus xyleni]SOC25110.1 DNA-binding transcriptional LysR family regulator [Ureibacillus xyleni]
MNLQQMNYVKVIAETKSINKASKSLHISQPALTKQLKLLEKELGTTLFKRSKSGVLLTSDGDIFLREAEIILDHVTRLKQRFTKKDVKKTIKIAALPSIANNLLPEIIQKFNSLEYKVVLHVVGTSQEIENLLLAKEIDVGFGQDVKEKDYVYTFLNEPYFVIALASSEFSKVPSISLAQLTEQNLILPTSPCDIRNSLDQYLRQEDIVLNNTMEIGENDVILKLVKNGVGVTILPEMSIRRLEQGLKAIPLIDNEFSRKISLLTYSTNIFTLVNESLR